MGGTAVFQGSRLPLHNFLKSYVLKNYPGADQATRVAIAFSDLNGDGKQEAVVYMMGPNWCGTGGCHALVLSPDGSTFKVVMDASVSRLPISVLPTKSHAEVQHLESRTY